MKRILLSIVLLVLAASLYGQGTPSEGKDYYLGFLYPSYNTVVPTQSAGYFKVYAIISSFQENTAYISYFNADGTETASLQYKIYARKAVQVPITLSNVQVSSDQTKEYKSVHITAKKPINVTYYSTGGCSGGMYLALPTNVLGTKYVVSSYRDNPNGYGARVGDQGPAFAEPSRGYYQIIGTYNSTIVTITNSGITSTGSAAKEPYSITLNRGQCYMVRSRCEQESDDISGSIIESDKPVVVLAGHENAQIGDMGSGIEQRDFMIEQMIPYDYWDNTGFIVVPMADGPTGGIGGKGDNIRINVFKDTMNVKPNIPTDSTTIIANSQIKTYQTLQYGGLKYPSSFSSEKKMSVMQYDVANHGSGAPFPRPSMMTIVPRSSWRNAYLWSVPSEYGLGADKSYVTIIAPKSVITDSIFLSKNGQKEVPIRSAGLSIAAEYSTIPNHADLKAIVYRLNSASYYARANFPFMAYSYGFRAVATDNNLSNNNNDELYHSYAMPLGMVFGSGDSAQMTIKVDTLCTGWHVCVTDKHVSGGIKGVLLVDDASGDIFPYTPPHGPYQYSNVSFPPDIDPNATRELNFSGLDSTVCFNVSVDNIGKNGYAPIFITDNSGNGKMIELYYNRAQVAYNPGLDTVINFGYYYVNESRDSTFTFVNQPTSGKSYILSEVDLITKSPAFKILSVTPPLPALIKKGDTVRIRVRFEYPDTGYFADSLLLKTDCFTTYWPLEGMVGTALIAISNHDFGTVVVGQTRCADTVSVRNVGSLSFVLTKDWLLSNSIDFIFDTTLIRVGNRNERLPITIPPGGSVKLYVCYSPHDVGVDTAELILGTDIRPPYDHSIKDVSHLKGNAVKPEVHWDIDTAYMKMDSTRTRFMRRFLLNTSTAPILVNNVFIEGPDVSEFKIAGMQDPLDIGIDTGTAKWIDISVTPDLTKPANYLRRARVVATNTFNPAEPDILELIAGFDVLKVQQELQLEELRIYPNPTLGEDITASFGLAEAKELSFGVYDMLGREVLSVPSSYFAKGKQSVTLPVSKLSEGGYILRASDGVLTRSINFRVVK